MKIWIMVPFCCFSFIVNAQLFKITEDTICRLTNLQISTVPLGQQAYNWKTSDGYTSSLPSPFNISFNSIGLKMLTAEITTKPGAVFADKVIVLKHEDESSITDPVPDVYFKIKDNSGKVIYVSQLYDEFKVPDTIIGSIILQNNETYLIEFWDYDLFDSDDFLGNVFFSNPNGNQTYEFGNLKITIPFETAELKYTHSVAVYVTDPEIVVEDNNKLYVELQGLRHEASTSNWMLNGTIVETILGIKPFIPKENGCFIAKYAYGAVCNFVETEPYCYLQSATSELNEIFYSFPTFIEKNTVIPIPDLNSELAVSIYNSQGMQVYNINNAKEINFSRLTSGLYFLSMKNKYTKPQSKKIIIF